MKTSTIQFNIELDDRNLPERMQWEASDAGMQGPAPCKALMLSVWDPNENNTLKIDLWTKDMLVDDMKVFFHQTLLSMASMLERSINEERMAGDMRDFCDYFAEKMGIVNNSSNTQP
jgi:gliding motility-associated protein GldC